MRHISDDLAQSLDGLLGECYDLAREHAAYQSYRSDAAKAMRERILADYHAGQALRALTLARSLLAVRTRLAESRHVTRTSTELTAAPSGNTVRMLSR